MESLNNPICCIKIVIKNFVYKNNVIKEVYGLSDLEFGSYLSVW